MTMVVNMHEAKSQLSKLVEAALKGEQVTIAKAGKPLVRLVPVSTSDEVRPAGVLKAKLQVRDDFGQPVSGPLGLTSLSE